MLDLVPSYELISDPFAIRTAVTAIRDAFTEPAERRPLLTRSVDRRKFGRLSFEVPVRILVAALDGAGVQVAQDGIPARTRDISLNGIGLAHTSPLPGRQAVAVFTPPDNRPISLVVEVVWSQAAAVGSWLSGVRILGVLDAGEPPIVW